MVRGPNGKAQDYLGSTFTYQISSKKGLLFLLLAGQRKSRLVIQHYLIDMRCGKTELLRLCLETKYRINEYLRYDKFCLMYCFNLCMFN